jgi:hypothetical protein
MTIGNNNNNNGIEPNEKMGSGSDHEQSSNDE